MTVQTALRRDLWRAVWRLATGDRLLALLLLSLSLYLVALMLIPQLPSASLDADRWLLQAQARFGAATGTLYRLGLFSLAASPLPSLLLAGLGFLLLVRAVAQAERAWAGRHARSGRWCSLAVLLSYVGVLLLLVGLLVNHLWGWRVEGLVGHPGDQVDIPGHGQVRLQPAPSGVRSGRAGVTVYVLGAGPELVVRAYGADGRPLELQGTRGGGSSELVLTLSPAVPEAYFAVVDAGLMGRVSIPPPLELSSGVRLHLQLFRIPTGDQVSQIELTEDALEVVVGEVRLEVERLSYLLVAAAHAPGRWLEVVGVALGGLGLLGALAWRIRACAGQRRLALSLSVSLVVLTLATVGVALGNLFSLGTLWDRSPVQAGLAAVWLGALAGSLALGSTGCGYGGEEE